MDYMMNPPEAEESVDHSMGRRNIPDQGKKDKMREPILTHQGEKIP